MLQGFLCFCLSTFFDISSCHVGVHKLFLEPYPALCLLVMNESVVGYIHTFQPLLYIIVPAPPPKSKQNELLCFTWSLAHCLTNKFQTSYISITGWSRKNPDITEKLRLSFHFLLCHRVWSSTNFTWHQYGCWESFQFRSGPKILELYFATKIDLLVWVPHVIKVLI